ncbi:fam-c protein [Plasmodium yoelii yoelii]|uniref:Fam-c protein n=1 Tax=Plasmodium yoelii yoelii TaxID=73239 RepID=A0AAF0B5W6_PLAYO|nr:fam-c protein [Plasmodium yoelii yoelii]
MFIPLYYQSKASAVGNKSVRGTKEININNETNGIEFKRETQLKNNNPKDDKDNEEFNCFNIFKRNKRTKAPSYSKESLIHLCNTITEIYPNSDKFTSQDIFQVEQKLQNIRENNPELYKILLESKEVIEKYLSKKKKIYNL